MRSRPTRICITVADVALALTACGAATPTSSGTGSAPASPGAGAVRLRRRERGRLHAVHRPGRRTAARRPGHEEPGFAGRLRVRPSGGPEHHGRPSPDRPLLVAGGGALHLRP